MRSAKLVIVGGGPAGLSLAYHYGRNSLVLEKETEYILDRFGNGVAGAARLNF